MNKIIVIIILSLLTFSCKKANNINGTIEGVPNGRKVTLKQQVEVEEINKITNEKEFKFKIVNIDSTTVQNGKFGFNVKLKEPTIVGIFIDSIGRQNEGIYPLLNINDKVNIITFKDSIHASKITGSKLNDNLTALRDMRTDINKKMNLLTPEFQAARKANDTAKINEINKKARTIQSEISLNEWKFIKANPSSHVSAMVLSGLFQDPKYRDSIKPAFNALTTEVKNSAIAKQLKTYLEKQEKKTVEVPKVVTPKTKK